MDHRTVSAESVTSTALGEMDQRADAHMAWLEREIARLQAMNPAAIDAMARFADLEVAR